MHWQFHYPKRNCFYPPDYEDPGLGGGEASLVLLTRALAARGHHVEVFNCCYRPGKYDGVEWRMAWEFTHAVEADVAVAVRFDEALWPSTSNARSHLFWMLDDRTGGPAAFADTFGNRGGLIVVASHAMRGRLDQAGLVVDTAMVPLPVEVDRYASKEPRQRVCLWSSMPNRGLDVALTIWPDIRAAVPDAELWVTSGWQLWGYTNTEAHDRWKQLLGNKPLPDGVRLFGAVPRTDLIELQQRSWLTLYPCRFPEMFCLAATESAAAGTPVVTSSLDALNERIRHKETGILIDGPIEESRTQWRFIDETIALLTDPARRDRYATVARQDVESLHPDIIAQTWERLACGGGRGG